MGKATGFMDYARMELPRRDPSERVKDYGPLEKAVSDKNRRRQSGRCMDCGVPFCQAGVKFEGQYLGCPLHNLIPEWNDQIYGGNWEHALARLTKTSSFPEFTGRVCPALCEAACSCGLYGDPVTVKENELAKEIGLKYLSTVEEAYLETGCLWEKYDVLFGGKSRKNEYQDTERMGWTAGTYLVLESECRRRGWIHE